MLSLDDIDRELTKSDSELFGDNPTAVYRTLITSAHPDRHHRDIDRATELSSLINSRFTSFTTTPTATVTSKKRTYALRDAPRRGDIANLYPVGNLYVKIPRSAADSDLLLREATALKRMASPPEEMVPFKSYALKMTESFQHKDKATGQVRRINVIENLDQLDAGRGRWYSLREVADAYPSGLDGRQIAWMWRRIYVACALAHSCGIIHGAIVPEHVMIHPTMHGVVLVDWCYSATAPKDDTNLVTFSYPPIPAFVPNRRDLYPPEIADKVPPTTATDLYMAAATLGVLIGKRTHPAFARFLKGCLLSSPTMRPQSALQIKEEFDSLLANLYGKRTYVALPMPPK